jgi:hypothetical protein
MTAPVWTIETLERRTADGFVYNVNWRVNAMDGEFFATAYGSVRLEGEMTTPYESLTEAQVIGWVKEALGAEQISQHEASVLAQIESQKAPATASGLPWAQA